MKRTLILLATIVIAAPFLAADDDGPCLGDHWSDPICEGTPTPLLPKYFSCYSTPGPGDRFCCKYETQNHSCQFPPPSIAKYFVYKGYYPGLCNSNEYGQWCDDMAPAQGGQ